MTFLQKFFLSLAILALVIFASNDLKADEAVIANSNVSHPIEIDNKIWKYIIAEYLENKEIFKLYRSNKTFYKLFEGENFQKWLEEKKLKEFFFTPLYEEKEEYFPDCNFTIKFPPGILVLKDTFEPWMNRVFLFAFCGTVKISGNSYFMTSKNEQKEINIVPQRLSHLNHQVISICKYKSGSWGYKFWNDPIKIFPDSTNGLMFKLKGKHIDIFDTTERHYFGSVKLRYVKILFCDKKFYPSKIPAEIEVQINSQF